MSYITLAIVHLTVLLLLHRSLDLYSYKINYMSFYFDQANLAIKLAIHIVIGILCIVINPMQYGYIHTLQLVRKAVSYYTGMASYVILISSKHYHELVRYRCIAVLQLLCICKRYHYLAINNYSISTVSKYITNTQLASQLTVITKH